MTVRQISAHEAVVKTATVEVKSLTISGKQVTLAVFRQLIDEDIIDQSGDVPEFRGRAWGSVNYHPDKCAEGSDHLHIVWQNGEHLRRAHVRMTKATPEVASRREDTHAMVTLACALRAIEGDSLKIEDYGYSLSQPARIVVGGEPDAPGTWWVRNVSPAALQMFRRLKEARSYIDGSREPEDDRGPYWGVGSDGKQRHGVLGAKSWLNEHMTGLRREIARKAWGDRIDAEQSSRAVMALYHEATKQTDAFAVKYGEMLDELASLDQLFIAV